MRSLFAVTLAPAIWILFFLVVYVFEIMGCRFELDRGLIAGVGLTVSALTILAIIVVAVFAWRRWRRNPRDGTESFLGQIGFLLCLSSLVATIWVALPIFLVPACM